MLHLDTIQEYETPIQVYQTMRLDQIIAAYHVTAMDATSNISAMTRPPATSATVAYHTSQNRILCSTHAINGLLVAGLVVNAVKPFQTRMAVAGLDPTVPTADEINAASASEVLYLCSQNLLSLLCIVLVIPMISALLLLCTRLRIGLDIG